MYSDPEFSRAKFQSMMGRLWARRSTAPARELPAIDGELWRLLEVFANPGKPIARGPAPYHGPVAEGPREVELCARDAARDAFAWTTSLILRRLADGRFRVEVHVVGDGRRHCAYRSRPFASGQRLASELVGIARFPEFDFGEARRDGALEALLPHVALLSRRLADAAAVALLTCIPGAPHDP